MSYVYFNLMLQLPGEGLEYSWLDVLKRQQLHLNMYSPGPLADLAPSAFEALKQYAISSLELQVSSAITETLPTHPE